MSRRLEMFGKALLPGVGVALLAVLLQAVMVAVDGGAPSLGPVHSIARWAPLAGFLSGIAMAVHATYRLLRWSDGHGPDCSACGGFLGHMRLGRDGPFRVCMACAQQDSGNVRNRYENAGSETHTG